MHNDHEMGRFETVPSLIRIDIRGWGPHVLGVAASTVKAKNLFVVVAVAIVVDLS